MHAAAGILPFAPPPPPPPLPEDLAAARILIVDDEPVNTRLLDKLLRLAGYHCLDVVNDPRQALPAMLREDTRLVLLDLNMPHVDGWALLEQLRQAGGAAHAPVLVLTAQADPVSRLRALQCGARDFLSKPFLREEVLARIRNLLEVQLAACRLARSNQELEQRVSERTRELEETRLEIIRRLGRVVEYRDNETGLHVLRMSHYTQCLALAAGLDEAQARLLLLASPMHDIGKVGIPDYILLKPGPLTEEERSIMRTHTLIGAEILSGHDSPLMCTARDIALTHHERWDGGGYPRGLAGEDIPLSGRLASLCDYFDALTSVRPYKAAWPVAQAVDEIRAQRGRAFDPRLVDLLLAQLPALLDIRARHEDPQPLS